MMITSSEDFFRADSLSVAVRKLPFQLINYQFTNLKPTFRFFLICHKDIKEKRIGVIAVYREI